MMMMIVPVQHTDALEERLKSDMAKNKEAEKWNGTKMSLP
jgi:hypothetical protein